MARSGKFRCKNPKKYKGDPTQIFWRSSWELRLMSYLDLHPHVIKWSSEEIIIPYKSPIDGRRHRYFPDFYVERINKQGLTEKILIEVKPAKETRPPEKQTRITKRYLREVKTWGVNQAKWIAAEEYCKDRGWRFEIFTEKELYG